MAQTCKAQDRSNFSPAVVLAAFEKAFEAAAEGALVLRREMIYIAQRNVNASFGLVRRLAAAKNLGEILDLQATYWRNQFGALMGQAKELRTLSTKVAVDMAEPIQAHIASSIDDVRKAS
jgi:phasin family protein